MNDSNDRYVSEGFGSLIDRIKNRNKNVVRYSKYSDKESPLQREIIDPKTEREFKKVYDECVRAVLPLIRGIKGFTIEPFSVRGYDCRWSKFVPEEYSVGSKIFIVRCDLYDFYPGEDVKTRFQNEDISEYNNMCSTIEKVITRISRKYGFYPTTGDGDWDMNWISIVKPGKIYGDIN